MPEEGGRIISKSMKMLVWEAIFKKLNSEVFLTQNLDEGFGHGRKKNSVKLSLL